MQLYVSKLERFPVGENSKRGEGGGATLYHYPRGGPPLGGTSVRSTSKFFLLSRERLYDNHLGPLTCLGLVLTCISVLLCCFEMRR